MSFNVPADDYLRFMGRYSQPLAEQFVDLVDVHLGDRVLDVGCGPGILTAPLVARCGDASVSAVDPSPPFVAAARGMFPGVDVREAAAEHLPYDDDIFDAALAQLVVHFMSDPVVGLGEMGRVTRAGGTVSASVWDNAGATGPLSLFWQAVHEVDPAATGEAQLAGSSEGHLAELAERAGLTGIRSASLTVRIPFSSFDEWWAPYLLGVGPSGAYVGSLDPDRRNDVAEHCRALLPEPPFEHSATAWVVLAEAPA
jgi:SAM-dependent methyltransferase